MLCVCILFSEMSRVFQELPEARPHLLTCKARTGPCSLGAPDLAPQLAGNVCPELWEQCVFSLSRFGLDFKILQMESGTSVAVYGKRHFHSTLAAQG